VPSKVLLRLLAQNVRFAVILKAVAEFSARGLAASTSEIAEQAMRIARNWPGNETLVDLLNTDLHLLEKRYGAIVCTRNRRGKLSVRVAAKGRALLHELASMFYRDGSDSVMSLGVPLHYNLRHLLLLRQVFGMTASMGRHVCAQELLPLMFNEPRATLYADLLTLLQDHLICESAGVIPRAWHGYGVTPAALFACCWGELPPDDLTPVSF
jgi:hypothetical protein